MLAADSLLGRSRIPLSEPALVITSLAGPIHCKTEPVPQRRLVIYFVIIVAVGDSAWAQAARS